MADLNQVPLVELAKQYLAHRRSLGFSLKKVERSLLSFARFHEDKAPGQPLQTSVMLAWVVQPEHCTHGYYVGRLSLVRGFSRYCGALDPRTQIPDYRLLGRGYVRIRPHIYSDRQITALLQRARNLSTFRSPLRPLTFETLIGLIACTGLRTCEALQLQRSDLDFVAQTLTVRKTKFSAPRVLPLHISVVRALQRYLDASVPRAPNEESFFLNRFAEPLRESSVRETFRLLRKGIRSNGVRSTPRIYDLRHTFATRHIAKWNNKNGSVAQQLLLLSRYMGHRQFSDTWWYVSADADALRRAASQFERFSQGGTHVG